MNSRGVAFEEIPSCCGPDLTCVLRVIVWIPKFWMRSFVRTPNRNRCERSRSSHDRYSMLTSRKGSDAFTRRRAETPAETLWDSPNELYSPGFSPLGRPQAVHRGRPRKAVLNGNLMLRMEVNTNRESSTELDSSDSVAESWHSRVQEATIETFGLEEPFEGNRRNLGYCHLGVLSKPTLDQPR